VTKNKSKELQKHKGSSLILVIATVGVLLILCSALGTGVVWEANNARNQEKKTQAYYIARSGAAATAKYIGAMNNTDMSTLVSQLPLKSDNNIFGNGTFNIAVPTITDGQLLIKSTGSVKNGTNSDGTAKYITDTVTVVLNNTISPTITTALFASTKITLNGGSETGDIGTNSIEANSIEYYNSGIINGNVIISNNAIPAVVVVNKDPTWIVPATVVVSPNNVVGNYPIPVMPSFPSGLTTRPNISLNGDASATISADGYYNSVVIDNNTTLTIDTSSGDRNIRINNLNIIQGKIIITGGNKVNLYVSTCSNINGYINSDGNLNGDKNKLKFYCNNTAPFTFNGSTHIYGSVIWGTGALTFTGSGAIIGNLTSSGTYIYFNGGSFLDSQILYAPNADITLNSGKIIGAVIGKTVTMTNAGFVVTLPSVLPTLPINTDSYQISYWR